ncbi:putative 1,4-beta-D-xylan synthase [Medicago truncatula]|nr:putative 1,4-beta-D-xylan synthase [Medicago truncatula]
MMDCGGDRICYVQFPQRFEGIDPSDRYANHNTVFFDVNMRALDGIQGPVYVGTGCLCRRTAIYGFNPPQVQEEATSWFCSKKKNSLTVSSVPEVDSLEDQPLRRGGSIDDEEMSNALIPKKFGNSTVFVDSIRVAEFRGRPLADHPSIKNGRQPGTLTSPRDIDAATIAKAISIILCWYEDKTEWGNSVGWIYRSVTEDVVTGYRMHNRG